MRTEYFARGRDLLYIDEGGCDLDVVRAALKAGNHGLRFNTVSSDMETRQFVERTGAWKIAPLPDLIILDLSESGMDLIRYLRQHPIWKLIPMVVLVCAAEQTTACYDLYVNACIRKPSSPEELARVIVGIQNFWLRVPQLLPSEPVLLSLVSEAASEN